MGATSLLSQGFLRTLHVTKGLRDECLKRKKCPKACLPWQTCLYHAGMMTAADLNPLMILPKGCSACAAHAHGVRPYDANASAPCRDPASKCAPQRGACTPPFCTVPPEGEVRSPTLFLYASQDSKHMEVVRLMLNGILELWLSRQQVRPSAHGVVSGSVSTKALSSPLDEMKVHS